MNRLLNISQWEKSNNSTLIEIELILMKILVIECIVSYKCSENTTNLYKKSFISQLLFAIFNHWLNH